MSASLQDILGFTPLTRALKLTSSGVPDPFPAEFSRVDAKNKIIGDRAKFIRLTGERGTAALAKYGSPAVRRHYRDIGTANVRMLHVYIEMQIDPLVMLQLQSFEQYTQDRGLEWLNYQLEAAGHLIANTRIISKATMLQSGAIYWNAAGQILPSSSGATETYDAGIPATHKNQVNGTIASSWASHSADIPGHIRALRQYAAQETGMMPETAMYGINVPKYFQQNDFIIPYLARMGDARDKFMTTGEIPNGLFTLQWVPVYTTFFTDDTETNQLIWNADSVVFTPSITQPDRMGQWWSQFEGSYLVPRTIDVQRDGMAALNSFETTYGMFSYAIIGYNPPGITIFFGDVQLGILRNEKAVFQATCAF